MYVSSTEYYKNQIYNKVFFFYYLDNIDTLDSRVRRFFTEARKSKPEQVDEDYKNIHQSYKLALDNAEEKVSMASQIYDLVRNNLKF